VDGAFFNGRIDMGTRQQASAQAPAKASQPGVALSAEETERMLAAKQ